MKTYRHLYPKICTWENLYQAWRKARKGKRGKPAAATFEFNLEANLIALHRELSNKRYQPGSYHSFYIHEPKRRLISAAPFRDRVVHHALCNVIEPIFERSFIYDSYANRIGKGTHRALDRCQQYSRRFRYYLQCDVQRFFPSIDHAILRSILVRRIRDDDALWLIDQILASGRGILLFHDDKETLWQWRECIEERLATLRLIHPGAQPRPVTEGIPFLGFVVYPTHRLVKRRKVVHYKRRLRSLVTAYEAGEIGQDRIQASVHGWINHVRYGDTWGLRAVTLNEVVL